MAAAAGRRGDAGAPMHGVIEVAAVEAKARAQRRSVRVRRDVRGNGAARRGGQRRAEEAQAAAGAIGLGRTPYASAHYCVLVRTPLDAEHAKKVRI